MDVTKPLIYRSIELILAATALACAFVCEASAGLDETGAIMIAIDKMRPGAAPTDFEFARTGRGGPAQWTVTSDTSAAVGLAIEQTSTDLTDYRFPLAIYQPVLASNVDVTLRFKAGTRKVDQARGTAAPPTHPHNYYVPPANAPPA